MEGQGVIPKKSVIAQAVLISFSLIFLTYSLKITWKIYKNFKKQDQTLFLTSLSVLLSIVFVTVTLSMELTGMLKEEVEERKYFYCLFRSFASISMLFIILAFLFDMFKWAVFLVSASLETSYLSSFEGEKLLVKKNK